MGILSAPAMSEPTIQTHIVLSTPDDTPDGITLNAHLIATVTSSGGGVPTGVVEFAVGRHHVVAMAPLDEDGVAEADVTLSDPRQRSVKAFYLGDGTYLKSHSNRVTMTPAPPYDPRIRTFWRLLKTRADGSGVYRIGVVVGYGGPIVPPHGTVTADSGFDCDAKFRPGQYKTTCKGRATPPATVTVSYTGDDNFLPGSAEVHL
jgi:hypothetical protein